MTVTNISAKPWEGELKIGDCVIYEDATKYVDSDGKDVPFSSSLVGESRDLSIMPTTMLEILEIKSIKNDKTGFCTDKRFDLPTYRIKYVISHEGQDSTMHTFPGYDYNAIALEEGRIDEATYSMIKDLETKRKKEVMDATILGE